jgi:hypothetical protein
MRAGSMSHEYPRAGSMSPELVYRAGSMNPDFPQQQGRGHTPMTEDELILNPAPPLPPPPCTAAHSDVPTAHPHALSPAEEAHLARAYLTAELRTFHCERATILAAVGAGPEYAFGFRVWDESEWVDLRRIGEVCFSYFSLAFLFRCFSFSLPPASFTNSCSFSLFSLPPPPLPSPSPHLS